MLNILSQSDVGLVRTNNEDYFFNDRENGLIIVADGVGGHEHGEIASRLAVESCYQYLTREYYLEDAANKSRTLMESIAFANRRVIEHKTKYLANSNMGTTLSCVHLSGGEISYAWIGDSRIYLIDRSRSKINQLSVDHTLFQEMADRGEVADSYKKNILSRMVGNNPYVRPEGASAGVRPGDMVLVCTDGLSDLVPAGDILAALAARKDDLQHCLDELISLAKGQGGRDNITVSLGVVE